MYFVSIIAQVSEKTTVLSTSRPVFRATRVTQTVDKPSAGKNVSICGQRASQSFPARRRENKMKYAKTKDMCLGFLHFYRASVRLWRARSPMQILFLFKPA